MKKENEIIILTKELAAFTEMAHQRFIQTKEEGIRGDFRKEVQPFADGVKDTVQPWRESAIAWVTENRPKNLHAEQVQTAADYLEVLSVQAFFPETSKKRFMDQIQSVEFILKSVISALEKDQKK